MQKKKRKRKNFIIIGVLIILIIIIGAFTSKEKDIIFYTKEDGIYLYHNKRIHKISNNMRIKEKVSIDKSYFLYEDNNDLFYYQVKTNKKERITHHPKDYQILENNNYLVLDENNTLYIYKNQYKLLIQKDVSEILNYNKDFILYKSKGEIYSYQTKIRKSRKVEGQEDFIISEDLENLIMQTHEELKIYSLKKNKYRMNVENVKDYACTNNSCTEMYYVTSQKELKNANSKVIFDENILEIKKAVKNEVIYTKYHENQYELYYKDGMKKSILLDKSEKDFTEIQMEYNRIEYMTGGVLKTITKSKSKERIISENVTKIIGKLKKEYVYMKNDNLYLGEKLLGENIDKNSPQIRKNKIYYVSKDNILYENEGKKKKEISKNVIEYQLGEKNIYYISTHEKGKNLYQYHGYKRKIDKGVKELRK